jgi:hypothetical protein
MSGATSAVMIGAAVIGTAATVYGQVKQGEAQANQASYQAQVQRNQAQVMENNAIAAEQNADYAGKVGMENASRESMKGAARMGKIKAAIAANGVDPNTGSAVDVEQSQREISKLDSLQVMSDAELKAYGYRSDAANARYAAASLRAGAGMTDLAGSDARTGSYFKAGGTLLSSLSSLPTKWGSGGTAPADIGAGASGYSDTAPAYSGGAYAGVI